jgi:acetyltransferase-like isoleucine patch superfamily enzyme
MIAVLLRGPGKTGHPTGCPVLAWIESSVERLSTHVKLTRCKNVGRGTRVLGRVWIRGQGEVHLGENVVLDGRTVPIELHARLPNSRIIVGDGVHIEGGTSIEAEDCVRIGRGCHLGAYVKIIDNHFHPIRGNRHSRPASSPVNLDENVIVEARAVILPGTWLMPDVRVCQGSVVSRRIPAGTTVSGVPATRRKEGAS